MNVIEPPRLPSKRTAWKPRCSRPIDGAGRRVLDGERAVGVDAQRDLAAPVALAAAMSFGRAGEDEIDAGLQRALDGSAALARAKARPALDDDILAVGPAGGRLDDEAGLVAELPAAIRTVLGGGGNGSQAEQASGDERAAVRNPLANQRSSAMFGEQLHEKGVRFPAIENDRRLDSFSTACMAVSSLGIIPL